MKKIICYGENCLEGDCPQHGAGFIIFEHNTSLRIPHEEIDKDLDSFYEWMKSQAFILWQNRYSDKYGIEALKELQKKWKTQNN